MTRDEFYKAVSHLVSIVETYQKTAEPYLAEIYPAAKKALMDEFDRLSERVQELESVLEVYKALAGTVAQNNHAYATTQIEPCKHPFTYTNTAGTFCTQCGARLDSHYICQAKDVTNG